MNKSTRNAAVSTLAFIAMLTVNALANILPINGMNTGEVSAIYPNLFTPAGITFSIWSVLYLLLAGFVVFHWAKRDAYAFAEMARLFWLSCLLNMLWIVLWHYLQINISVTLMLLLLLTLIQLFLKVRKISMTRPVEKIFIRLPFTLYFAWICVATIANISALLVSNHWNGAFLSPTTWTIVMMVVASLLAFFITTKYRVPTFTLVVMWALFGIFLRWHNTNYQVIAYAALGLMFVLSITAFNTWRKMKFAFL